MTDRELLELAAKAADIDYEPDNQNVWPWNPLTDDGDALRLAVALRLIVDPFGAEHGCTVKHRPEGSRRAKELWSCGTQGDDCASTRRAIVFAAAKLGQSLAATSSGDSR